jgi:hypothetical protein
MGNATGEAHLAGLVSLVEACIPEGHECFLTCVPPAPASSSNSAHSHHYTATISRKTPSTPVPPLAHLHLTLTPASGDIALRGEFRQTTHHVPLAVIASPAALATASPGMQAVLGEIRHTLMQDLAHKRAMEGMQEDALDESFPRRAVHA